MKRTKHAAHEETPGTTATPTPPYESAISQADLDQIILAHKLGLRPPVRLEGPLWPEIRKVSNVVSFLGTVFEHCEGMDMMEAASGLAELMDQLYSQLNDLEHVARQRDELHGYSAAKKAGVQ
jgi:hypothetical protein